MKNTRQALAAILVALLAAIFIVGCSDGSEDDTSSLIGTWQYTYEGTTYTYVFNSGGTFTTTDGEETYTYSGTWRLSGSTLTLTMSEGGDSQTVVYSVTFSGDTMTLEPISATITMGGQTENITADEMGSAVTMTRVS